MQKNTSRYRIVYKSFETKKLYVYSILDDEFITFNKSLSYNNNSIHISSRLTLDKFFSGLKNDPEFTHIKHLLRVQVLMPNGWVYEDTFNEIVDKLAYLG